MPDKVTLVRSDGSQLSATPQEAERLSLLGYKPLSEEEHDAELHSQATSDYYNSPGQQALAGVEGFGSGLTFGGSDYLEGALGADVKERAQANPGTRAATELLGALAPLLVTGGASVGATGESLAEGIASRLPTSVLSEGASLAAPGAAGSLTKAVASGLIEGGVYGGTGAADHAYLDGSPITAEAVLHGIGWGAVIGGGLGGAFHGLGRIGESLTKSATEEAAAKSAAEEAAKPVVDGTLRTTAGDEYKAFKAETSRLSESLKTANEAADASVKEIVEKAKAQGEFADLSAWGNSEVKFAQDLNKTEPLYDKLVKAVDAGRGDAAELAGKELSDHITELGDKLGFKFADSQMKPIQDLISMRSVQKELSTLPTSVEGFAAMSSTRVERALAAMDKVGDLPFENVSQVTQSAKDLSKALGIDSEGDLRGTWRTAKRILNSEGKVPRIAKQETKNEPSFLRTAVGYALGGKTYVAARAAGFGHFGSVGAAKSVRDAVIEGGQSLGAIRAKVIGGLRDAAAKFLPKTDSAARQITPKLGSLSTTLFGQQDTSSKDPKTLAANRIKEINNFAPAAADSIFKAVEPLSVTQPDLAKTMHQSALASFQALQSMLPKDPGAISKLQSLWKPTDVHAMVLAKQLDVFNNPAAEATNMINAGVFDPVKVDALKQFAPALWQDVRVAMLQRITQPPVAAKLSYHDQIGLSTMLDLPIHTSMTPEFIATSQQMFLDRKQPLKANPTMGQNGGAPNPRDNVNATQAQKTEAH